MINICSDNRVELIENYVNAIVNELSNDEIKSLLIDYIYDEKSKMSNVALVAEINDSYPSLLDN